MTTPCMAEQLLDRMTDKELAIAARVESVLPDMRSRAVEADLTGEFPIQNIKLLSDSGLLGLMVPESYGGLGGTLRDLAAACYAMGSACPSTALAYFFHCSASSRGILPLKAIEAGLFTDEEAPVVKAFAEKVLNTMGRDGQWLANFASESNKKSSAMVTIATEAVKVDGGWKLNGVKSFGCASGVADQYLVTAKLSGYDTAEGLATFFVQRDAPGVSERERWDSIGMRACANHGLILKDVFVADEEALTVPNAFVKSMQMSRGTFVGNQPGATCCYLGIAKGVYDFTINYLTEKKFEDTGRPVGEGPMHQQIIGQMAADLESAMVWMRRQIDLETSEVELKPKHDVENHWYLAKGSVAEAAFDVAKSAIKVCGTGNTLNTGVIARGLRDISVGLVQALPAEYGKLYVAKDVIANKESDVFST